MSSKLKKKNGFGLIEVMTAIVVMVIVIGAAGAVTSQAINTATGAQESIVASGLAQELLEEARLSRDKNPNGPISVKLAPIVKLNNIEYSQELKITDNQDDALSGRTYWEVYAKITWRDSKTNKDKQYAITSILTQW